MPDDKPARDAPPVDVTLPPALLRLFPEAPPSLQVTAASVSGLLDALDERWPGMRDRLADSTPAIRRHINIFVEGRRSRLDTPLEPGTKVFIITAISGG